MSVAYPFAPVSMDAAGGAEQVLAMLDGELTRAGHRSVVLALDGSRVAGELVPLPAASDLSAEGRAQAYSCLRGQLLSAIGRFQPGLIHYHGVDFHQYPPPAGLPTLVTLHLPRSYYPASLGSFSGTPLNFNFVSGTQKRSYGVAFQHFPVVRNGVLIDRLPFSHAATGEYILALGRICPEKGFHLAVRAADRASIPLWLAGRVFDYPEHLAYWRETLQPALKSPHRYVGPVATREKVALLGGARCLVIPSLVEETSSLVAMEALACGTPVVAFRTGALPELIQHGTTGFLVSGLDEMAEAIHSAGALDRAACRATAESRFSGQTMVRRYLDLYRRIAK